MSAERLERRSRAVVLAPLAWVVAVILALGVQLIVCVRGTDADSTVVRVAIVVVGLLALVASVVGALPAWRERRERRERTDAEPPLDPTLALVATTAIGSLLVILVAVLVPTNAVC
jgi:amino acid transporter